MCGMNFENSDSKLFILRFSTAPISRLVYGIDDVRFFFSFLSSLAILQGK